MATANTFTSPFDDMQLQLNIAQAQAPSKAAVDAEEPILRDIENGSTTRTDIASPETEPSVSAQGDLGGPPVRIESTVVSPARPVKAAEKPKSAQVGVSILGDAMTRMRVRLAYSLVGPDNECNLKTLLPVVYLDALVAALTHRIAPEDINTLASKVPLLGGANACRCLTHRYPDASSLFFPLQLYLAALRLRVSVAVADKSAALQINRSFFTYMAHLVDLSGRHPWDAVLRFHMDFHRARLSEMRDGNYSGWVQRVNELVRAPAKRVVSQSVQTANPVKTGAHKESAYDETTFVLFIIVLLFLLAVGAFTVCREAIIAAQYSWRGNAGIQGQHNGWHY